MSALSPCEDRNENAWLTRGSQGRIHFPGSSNNSLWARLCSDFNLWTLRSCWRTLMFCLNELTVLLDAALQSIDSPTCDNHHVCPAIQNLGSCARKCGNICGIAVEWLLFSAAVYPRRGSLICEARRAGLGCPTLQPCSIHKTEPLCGMRLQGTSFVTAWARQAASFFPLHFRNQRSSESTRWQLRRVNVNKSRGLAGKVPKDSATCRVYSSRFLLGKTDSSRKLHQGWVEPAIN